MSPPLRASNEHCCIVRVLRAQGTHQVIPLASSQSLTAHDETLQPLGERDRQSLCIVA